MKKTPTKTSPKKDEITLKFEGWWIVEAAIYSIAANFILLSIITICTLIRK
jgi:hypothetical protein